ncbi:hypothetical protein PLICRDRAFT_171832 [Plicaturopsis crispa FD-325 SS-3]|nr:hypothetical protein PLICRDRAFT_171832 [Plicaturopsis crispa FD-325 SS-3]
MSETSRRPSLPTSSSDFALPPSSSASTSADDDANSLRYRFRRPSILAPKATYLSESRLSSPLTASFTIPSRRNRGSGEESESDRERMWTDSSPSSSSENPTPPLGRLVDAEKASERVSPGKRRRGPSTPPRNRSPSSGMDIQDMPLRLHTRRPSHPLKPHRILNLLAEESRPEESEVKSEAAFQRLVTSCSELPMQPRTPRAPSDRGRYPEEAIDDDIQREDSPSDGEEDEPPFAFAPTSSEPIPIGKSNTPSNSINGDDMFISESPGGIAMDVDLPSASPSVSSTPGVTHWRYTPPPTSTSAVRSNKRKLEDRYDPYPSASKRRAVSPSLAYLRGDSHPALASPAVTSRRDRYPIPLAIPVSNASSVTSSPTISSYPSSGLPMPRPMSLSSNILSSPTMRLASPILRPMPRTANGRRSEGEEREIEGAGDGVGCLTLG